MKFTHSEEIVLATPNGNSDADADLTLTLNSFDGIPAVGTLSIAAEGGSSLCTEEVVFDSSTHTVLPSTTSTLDVDACLRDRKKTN